MRTDWLLSQEFLQNHPVEASRVLVGLTFEETKAYLEEADLDTAVAMLQYVSPRIGSHCLMAWSDERVKAVLERLPMASQARTLRLMTSKDQERMLELAPGGVARSLRSVLRYPEGTAATWTDLEWSFVTEDLLMDQVWKILRRQGTPIGPYVYVVDRQGALVGVASLDRVLTARPRVALESLMHRPVERISAYDRLSTVVNHPAWQRFPTLPVVDDEGILLGRIRYSTLRDLERGLEPGDPSDTWRHFALSLAELYWVSSSNILRGISGMMTSAPAPTPGIGGNDEA